MSLEDQGATAVKFLAVAGIAALAGFVNYLQRFTGDDSPDWNWIAVTAKVFTAGFVGILTHWLLTGWGINENHENLVNFAIAVAGYGGAETIAFFQQVFQDAIRRAAGAAQNHDAKDQFRNEEDRR